MTGISLKGMTWSHPRGYDPMVACSSLWREKTGVTIEWDKRSLQDFESFPVEELARTYDLIVIDHPHVGQITKENCLLPLDSENGESALRRLAEGSVGQSFPSYNWQGRQWAFPIDAAAQVQAWRPDLINSAPKTWDEMLRLARKGQVILPLLPPHNLMTFFTLAGNLGHPCVNDRPGDLIDIGNGSRVFDMMREIAELIDPACFEMDPIAALERLAETSAEACAPLIYGYVSYAMKGFRANPVTFADIPSAGESGVRRIGPGRYRDRCLCVFQTRFASHLFRLLDCRGRYTEQPLCRIRRPAWARGRMGRCRDKCGNVELLLCNASDTGRRLAAAPARRLYGLSEDGIRSDQCRAESWRKGRRSCHRSQPSVPG